MPISSTSPQFSGWNHLPFFKKTKRQQLPLVQPTQKRSEDPNLQAAARKGAEWLAEQIYWVDESQDKGLFIARFTQEIMAFFDTLPTATDTSIDSGDHSPMGGNYGVDPLLTRSLQGLRVSLIPKEHTLYIEQKDDTGWRVRVAEFGGAELETIFETPSKS